MPEYIRTCKSGHKFDIIEHMLYSTAVLCPECNGTTWRKPQALAVTWGGLPPSRGELSPKIKALIDDAPRRRDQEVAHKNNRIVRLENGKL